MVNASLADGLLSDSQKHAIVSVSPLLKKPGLDVADMANYPSLVKPDVRFQGD